MWSEATSALRRLARRGDVEGGQAAEALRALREAPMALERPEPLAADAYDLARQLGWARTYDAEYLALARRLG